MEALYIAASAGDEQWVRELLAAGFAADAGGHNERLPIHVAALYGHVGIVQLLLRAAPATASAVASEGLTPLHLAAYRGCTAVVQLLLKAAPSTVTATCSWGVTPLYCAVVGSHVESVQLLAEAAPATVTASSEENGPTALYLALCASKKSPVGLQCARCLVSTAPTVQPTLASLARARQASATLYADLASRLALTQQEWQSIRAPCPDLVRALPAVLERSVAEAGWLVGRLSRQQRAQLRTAALCLGRMAAGVNGAPSLPAELSQRILALAFGTSGPPAAFAPRSRSFRWLGKAAQRLFGSCWRHPLVQL